MSFTVFAPSTRTACAMLTSRPILAISGVSLREDQVVLVLRVDVIDAPAVAQQFDGLAQTVDPQGSFRRRGAGRGGRGCHEQGEENGSAHGPDASTRPYNAGSHETERHLAARGRRRPVRGDGIAGCAEPDAGAEEEPVAEARRAMAGAGRARSAPHRSGSPAAVPADRAAVVHARGRFQAY